MAIAYIALGSNLGNRRQNLAAACDLLQTAGRVVGCSSLYETEPVGLLDQPPFLNGVVALDTTSPPLTLLHQLLAIERKLGRDRAHGIPKGPRIVDLDLLLVGDVILTEPELTLPHPALDERRFVLAPLAEIAPQQQHPRLQRTIADLLYSLPDQGENRIGAVRRVAGRDWHATLDSL